MMLAIYRANVMWSGEDMGVAMGVAMSVVMV